jgi:hypothetical protein
VGTFSERGVSTEVGSGRLAGSRLEWRHCALDEGARHLAAARRGGLDTRVVVGARLSVEHLEERESDHCDAYFTVGA